MLLNTHLTDNVNLKVETNFFFNFIWKFLRPYTYRKE